MTGKRVGGEIHVFSALFGPLTQSSSPTKVGKKDCVMGSKGICVLGGYVASWVPLKKKENLVFVSRVLFILYFFSLEVVIWCLKTLTRT